MTTESTYAFVVVGLEREDEPVSTITEILAPLGIPHGDGRSGPQFRRAPTPHHRVAEAILALELQGFVDVLAYQTSDGPTTAE